MIYTTTELRADYSRRHIDLLVREGTLARAGHYLVTQGTEEAVVAALRAGARPTCLTAAKHHGLWLPPGKDRHVYTRRGLRVPDAWATHGWTRNWPEPDPVASPGLLLEHASRCLDRLDVGILADSALREGKLDEADVAAVARTAPPGVARVLDRVSSLAESGTESKVRLFFQLRRVPVRAQVEIPGVGRVDLLVGHRWIVECDSRAHHTGESAYEYDRARDICSAELGYATSRLTHGMVFGEWDQTVGRLDRIIASRQHLVPPERWIRMRRHA